MKQKIKKNIPTNAFIRPSEQIVKGITQDILDVQDCLNTNTMIIKNPAKYEKHNTIEGPKKRKPKTLKDIPAEISSESENWNGLKKSTFQTPESTQNSVLNIVKDSKEHLDRFAKSAIQKSSGMMRLERDTIIENTSKTSYSIRKSLKRLFSGKKSIDQKDLDLLKRMAELEQEGILSPKEFSLMKKQILKKL